MQEASFSQDENPLRLFSNATHIEPRGNIGGPPTRNLFRLETNQCIDPSEDDDVAPGPTGKITTGDGVKEIFNPLQPPRGPATFSLVADDIWSDRGPAPSLQVDYLSHDWTELAACNRFS